MSVNKVLMVGFVGHDPELRHTPKGNPVLTLSLATHRNGKDEEGKDQPETHWHKAVLWGKLAETCARHLVTGTRIYVEGELQSKAYTDKDGVRRKSTEIYVDQLRFLGGPRRDTGASPASAADPAPAPAPAMDHVG